LHTGKQFADEAKEFKATSSIPDSIRSSRKCAKKVEKHWCHM
jgi:hypothetical protein